MFPFLHLPEPHDASLRARQSATPVRYGPLDNAFSPRPSPSPQSPTAASPTSTPNPQPQPQTFVRPFDPSLTSNRSLRQLTLFLTGSAFAILSLLITRRSIRRKLTPPVTLPTYTPSHPPPPVNGSFEAAEALGLATLNVSAFTMMGVGGLLWAGDLSTPEEVRGFLRQRLFEGEGKLGERLGTEESEKEIEEWMAGVLSNKDQGELMKALASPEGVLQGFIKQQAEKKQAEDGAGEVDSGLEDLKALVKDEGKA